jgi:hypothetical protein
MTVLGWMPVEHGEGNTGGQEAVNSTVTAINLARSFNPSQIPANSRAKDRKSVVKPYSVVEETLRGRIGRIQCRDCLSVDGDMSRIKRQSNVKKKKHPSVKARIT